jgi:alpha-galactosidase
MRNSPTVAGLRLLDQQVAESPRDTRVVSRLTNDRGLTFTHTLVLFAHLPAAEVHTAVCNTGPEPQTLEMLSSFTLGSLSPFGQGLDPETLVIHRMRSHWSAEGRLVSEPAEDLQLEPSWKPASANSLRFGCVGSLPVRGYVPFCAVEDTARGVTWAAATTQGVMRCSSIQSFRGRPTTAEGMQASTTLPHRFQVSRFWRTDLRGENGLSRWKNSSSTARIAPSWIT